MANRAAENLQERLKVEGVGPGQPAGVPEQHPSAPPGLSWDKEFGKQISGQVWPPGGSTNSEVLTRKSESWEFPSWLSSNKPD